MDETHELLIRLDERTSMIWERMQSYEQQYITKKEFWPVRMIVYSGAGVTLLGVMTALVGLVVIK